MVVEPITRTERASLLAVATATGLFTADEAESLLGRVLDQLASRSLPAGHSALACREMPGGSLVGWTYFAPDQHAEGVWNVWWLGVDPASHGTGAGLSLLRRAEARAATDGARLMIIETSSKDSQARARRFYVKEGYAECGRIPDFYGEGDAKVIFARRPRPA